MLYFLLFATFSVLAVRAENCNGATCPSGSTEGTALLQGKINKANKVQANVSRHVHKADNVCDDYNWCIWHLAHGPDGNQMTGAGCTSAGNKAMEDSFYKNALAKMLGLDWLASNVNKGAAWFGGHACYTLCQLNEMNDIAIDCPNECLDCCADHGAKGPLKKEWIVDAQEAIDADKCELCQINPEEPLCKQLPHGLDCDNLGTQPGYDGC